MEPRERFDRLGWFIPLRLASFVIIFAVVVLWMHYPGFLRLQFITYSVFTLFFTVLLAFDKKLRRPSSHKTEITMHVMICNTLSEIDAIEPRA